VARVGCRIAGGVYRAARTLKTTLRYGNAPLKHRTKRGLLGDAYRVARTGRRVRKLHYATLTRLHQKTQCNTEHHTGSRAHYTLTSYRVMCTGWRIPGGAYRMARTGWRVLQHATQYKHRIGWRVHFQITYCTLRSASLRHTTRQHYISQHSFTKYTTLTSYRVACVGWRKPSGVHRVACTGWRIAGSAYWVVRTGWRVPGGPNRVARAYGLERSGWRVAGGAYRVARTVWRAPGVASGSAYRVVRTGWGIPGAAYCVACPRWHVLAGARRVARTLWRILGGACRAAGNWVVRTEWPAAGGAWRAVCARWHVPGGA